VLGFKGDEEELGLPLGVRREEEGEGVDGGEEVQRPLQGLEAELLQRVRLDREPICRRG
jgi:hypothetical protein